MANLPLVSVKRHCFDPIASSTKIYQYFDPSPLFIFLEIPSEYSPSTFVSDFI